ncbi:MAG: hypothetical protein CSA20_04195 [Deltaproteobacteria bacterium]|nr:MAG: hypothetical protein CSA20_04195 [Deltaproteobacteria bacterium]
MPIVFRQEIGYYPASLINVLLFGAKIINNNWQTPVIRFFILFLTTLFCTACNGEKTVQISGSCQKCHMLETDKQHRLQCTHCHRGDVSTSDKDLSHKGMVAHPAHPEQMTAACAPCHAEIVRAITTTSHFTLKRMTNKTRQAFGATEELASFTETPEHVEPENNLELVDDLLRRRCFRCHLFSSGDRYPATGHGQGCAACHLPYYDGALEDHRFSSPDDRRCLSCHYGNYTGFDYYGRFEHDYNREYRTPYTTTEEHPRPYGVEFHQLSSDIHQQKGMLCIDCHSGEALMRGRAKASCAGCHDRRELAKRLPPKVKKTAKGFVLSSRKGKEHLIPILTDPAHNIYGETVSCQACHAQWSFTDRGKYFLRIDTDDLEAFFAHTVQGSLAIERLLVNNLSFTTTDMPITMADGITGKQGRGIWLKGFLTRRWEEIPLGRDEDGKIAVVRPILDLHLSWLDTDEEVRFDNSTTMRKKMQAYTPHTTGKAGLFFGQRLQDFISREQAESPFSSGTQQ